MSATTTVDPPATANVSVYRGRCKYKSGRCPNERTLKYNGDIHTLCEEHRQRHNQIQCKSDTKIRFVKRQKALLNKLTAASPQSSTTNSKRRPPSATVTLIKQEQRMDEMALQTPPKKLQPLEFTAPSFDWSDEETFIFTNLMGVATATTEAFVFSV
ncbi:hypothetical protein SPRG_07278 [Saprolegnia parasitica CBS 223.65]|uniref:Uncharacterized protein n=1 Tax=Saprolegnia parasitica (strain CBS 223.65) TaxID=695850 RepID=A0A067CFP3_SAPPC|nr:hypothetical protein SPRG_07278 [Saprolegnia parasitica CBS 223.65]KDO28000.1 hypothetical protein SPRG_07278 [Saprolegnia parasitica CBS 223.65]|eukprot:XP_012201448.1 hypothetical protein SPRG_07278 [Saprolegnia parasitica CBS 223.65]